MHLTILGIDLSKSSCSLVGLASNTPVSTHHR